MDNGYRCAYGIGFVAGLVLVGMAALNLLWSKLHV